MIKSDDRLAYKSTRHRLGALEPWSTFNLLRLNALLYTRKHTHAFICFSRNSRNILYANTLGQRILWNLLVGRNMSYSELGLGSGADSIGHGGHQEYKNSKQETGQTVGLYILTIKKALTKTTNCTFRAKEVEGHDKKNSLGHLCIWYKQLKLTLHYVQLVVWRISHTMHFVCKKSPWASLMSFGTSIFQVFRTERFNIIFSYLVTGGHLDLKATTDRLPLTLSISRLDFGLNGKNPPNQIYWLHP